ncbi:hypothetical protein HID58_060157 [Brassica napus]|uniref:Uncharacterized protein n=1 Tax=Brassica napus TaxID=3708 RepID=A0ABQ7ZVS4_BRANA|nr:hypothetical protein HID58_060157 [Brassica napus]
MSELSIAAGESSDKSLTRGEMETYVQRFSQRCFLWSGPFGLESRVGLNGLAFSKISCESPMAVGQPIRQTTPISSHSVPWNPTTTTEGDNRPYQQRLDRHGKPFGDRFSTALFRPTGPKNKIAPRLPHDYDRSKENLRENDEKEYSSPPYTRRRLNNHGEAQRRENHSTRHRGSPTLQWRAKSPLINPTDKGQGSETHNEGNSRAPKQWRARSPLLAQEATPPSALFQPPRSSLPPPRETEPAASGPTANPARKRRRPRRTTDRRTTVKHSPKTFLGTGSRK